MYIDYEKYKSLGGLCKDTIAFNRLEFQCEKIVDRYTSNRLKSLKNYPQELEMLMVELIDKYSNQAKTNIQSESNDGYSVSYKDVTTEASNQQDLNLVLTYLGDYCYLGVY